MQYKIIDESPWQILSNAMTIGPSSTGYQLQVAADGRNYTTLFTVGAGITRQITNLSSGSYFRMKGNEGEVTVNWVRSCGGGSGGGGNAGELEPVSEFPVGVPEGTVVALASGDTVGVYQYDGTEWVSVGGDLEERIDDVERVTAFALTELHDAILEISGSTGSGPIIPAINTQAEYEAISGDVKTGDLIQVQDVDINGDNEPEIGLFAADVQEEEYEGVVRKSITWERRDSADSVLLSYNVYPWMAENGIMPIEFLGDTFLISSDMTTEGEEAYNGIGFDIDGKPVITHIAPAYDDETGEYGITREDRDILGELDDVAADINEAFSAITETQRVAAAGLNQLEGRIDDKVSSSSVSTIWRGTQAEYDAITTPDASTLYIIINN